MRINGGSAHFSKAARNACGGYPQPASHAGFALQQCLQRADPGALRRDQIGYAIGFLDLHQFDAATPAQEGQALLAADDEPFGIDLPHERQIEVHRQGAKESFLAHRARGQQFGLEIGSVDIGLHGGVQRHVGRQLEALYQSLPFGMTRECQTHQGIGPRGLAPERSARPQPGQRCRAPAMGGSVNESHHTPPRAVNPCRWHPASADG